MKSVLFVVRGGPDVPSCRFRAWDLAFWLQKEGVDVRFLKVERSRNVFRQLTFLFRLAWMSWRVQAVVYQKLAEPWRIRWARLFNDNVLYDFDDAMYCEVGETRFARTVRSAYRVIAGNAVLAERASRYNPSVDVIPTLVSMPSEESAPEPHGESPILLGWVGTSPNLPYLAPVVQALEETHAQGFRLEILTNIDPDRWFFPWVDWRRWSHEEERQHLQRCDIGLMPLPDTEWCRGKCACKALQYLSHGKYVLTDAVGVNRELFSDPALGRLVESSGWKPLLEQLPGSQKTMRKNEDYRREFIAARFSPGPWIPKYLEVLFGDGHRRQDHLPKT